MCVVPGDVLCLLEFIHDFSRSLTILVFMYWRCFYIMITSAHAAVGVTLRPNPRFADTHRAQAPVCCCLFDNVYIYASMCSYNSHPLRH